eukprot:TRINITY_DN13200_c0_g1_i1.p1 TRINITY_DN13200_c0_g1~~TRINITY_DN13200_c0_g1_i1.p1  ORF type:complete len:246 (-),score=36.48 TRINITY_DN13200_c0_g1_i1:421-1158(-)
MTDGEADLLRHWFGSLHAAMHTLTRCILGGLDWASVAEVLRSVDWLWTYVFTGFVAFCILVLLNSITGVLCQCAMESAQRDHEQLINSMRADANRHEKTLTRLFSNISSDGVITLVDFESQFQSDEVKAFFQSLNLEPSDAWSLFKLIDRDGTGDIDIGEFLEGCLALRGPAKAIDIATLMQESRAVREAATQTNIRAEVMVKSMKNLRAELRKVQHLAKPNKYDPILRDAVHDVIHEVFFQAST